MHGKKTGGKWKSILDLLLPPVFRIEVRRRL